MGWLAPVQTLLESPYSPIGQTLTKEESSWLSGAMCIGGAIGTLILGSAADRWGRKIAGALIAIPLLISWGGILLASSFRQLVTARLIAGLGCGGILALNPLYVSEISEPLLRGALSAYMVLFINIGILFEYSAGAILTWSQLNAVCLVIPMVFLCVIAFVPESPAWFVSKGRIPEARKSMLWLRANDEATSDAEIDRMASNQVKVKVGFRGLWEPGCQKALLLSCTLLAVQQFSGVFAILTYTVELFAESGSQLSPYLCTIIVGSLQLFGSYLACSLIDRLGRKVLLIASLSIMGSCLCGLATIFYIKSTGKDTAEIGWLPVTCLSVYIVCFALGIGPVPYVIIAEIFPIEVRSLASSINILWLFILAFAITKLYVPLASLLGIYGTYWLFSLCCALGVVFTFFFIPETKGRRVEDIIKDLRNDSKLERCASESV